MGSSWRSSDRGGPDAGKGADKKRVAEADLEPVEIQDFADAVPKLWEIKAKSNVPVKVHVRIEVGDGKETPPQEVVDEINTLLADLKDGLQAN